MVHIAELRRRLFPQDTKNGRKPESNVITFTAGRTPRPDAQPSTPTDTQQQPVKVSIPAKQWEEITTGIGAANQALDEVTADIRDNFSDQKNRRTGSPVRVNPWLSQHTYTRARATSEPLVQVNNRLRESGLTRYLGVELVPSEPSASYRKHIALRPRNGFEQVGEPQKQQEAIEGKLQDSVVFSFTDATSVKPIDSFTPLRNALSRGLSRIKSVRVA